MTIESERLSACRAAFCKWVEESGADLGLEMEHDDTEPDYYYSDSRAEDAFAGFRAAYDLYAGAADPGPGEYTERWECRVCGPPCRVEIQTSDEKLPDYLKKDNDRFRRRECFCNETTPRWVHLPSEKVREALADDTATKESD